MFEIIDNVWPPEPGMIKLTDDARPQGGASASAVGRLMGSVLQHNVPSPETRVKIIQQMLAEPDAPYAPGTDNAQNFMDRAMHAALAPLAPTPVGSTGGQR